ncbi:MAG: photosynthetic reaction center subunit H, partial [Pseudomonadota bacterium]
MEGQIVGSFDLTQGLLYLFWIFFFGLVLYIQRESNREGYPLEPDKAMLTGDSGVIFRPDPKVYPQMHGKTHYAPTLEPRAEPKVASERVAPFPGAPYDPSGDPLTAGVGPGAY